MKTMDQPAFRPVRPDQPFLLATDLDGTLLGDESVDPWLKMFVQQYEHCFHLAYVTGRRYKSVLQLVEDGHLPRPNYICSNSGTELFDFKDPQKGIGERFGAQVTSQWNLEEIYTLGEGLGVRRQEFLDDQPRFSAGFHWDGDPKALADLKGRLIGREGYHILASQGKFIDVLPAALGKGNAVRFLQHELCLDSDRVVVAGDSGNDRLMFETDFKGILPANVLDELRIAACQPWHYYSPFPAARGVLDGLCHFGFVIQV